MVEGNLLRFQANRPLKLKARVALLLTNTTPLLRLRTPPSPSLHKTPQQIGAHERQTPHTAEQRRLPNHHASRSMCSRPRNFPNTVLAWGGKVFSQEVTLLLDVCTLLPLRFMQVLHVMFETPSISNPLLAQNTVIIKMSTVGLMHMQAKPSAVTEVSAQCFVKLGHHLGTAWASSIRRRLRRVPEIALMPDLQCA